MVEITPYILTFCSGSINSEIFLYVYIIFVVCKRTLFSPTGLWVCRTLNEEKFEETADMVLPTGEYVGERWEGDKTLVEVLQFTSSLSEMSESGETFLELRWVPMRLGDGPLSKVLSVGSLLKVLGSLFRQTNGGHLVDESLWELRKFWKKNIP